MRSVSVFWGSGPGRDEPAPSEDAPRRLPNGEPDGVGGVGAVGLLQVLRGVPVPAVQDLEFALQELRIGVAGDELQAWAGVERNGGRGRAAVALGRARRRATSAFGGRCEHRVDRGVHVLEVRPERADGEPGHDVAARLRRGQEHVSRTLQVCREPRRRRRIRVPGDAERHDRQVRRRADLDRVGRGEPGVRVPGQQEFLGERGLEGLAARELQREPDPHRPKGAGELRAEVGGRRGVGGGEVVGTDPERLAEHAHVPQQQRPGAVGDEERLVRVDDQGVGATETGEDLTALGAEREQAAVGRVDVQPELLGRRDVGDRLERVDGAGVRGPRGGDDEKGTAARGAVGPYGGRERGGVHAQPVVGADAPDEGGSQAGDAERHVHAVVGVLAEVDDQVVDVGQHLERVARGHDGGEGGAAAPRGQHASRRGAQADDVGEPADDHRLQGGRPRTDRGQARVAVGRGREEVADGCGEQTPRRDVAEVPRGGRGHSRPVHEPRHQLEDLLRISRSLGDAEALQGLRRTGAVHPGGVGRHPGEEGLDVLHGQVREPSTFIGVGLQGRRERPEGGEMRGEAPVFSFRHGGHTNISNCEESEGHVACRSHAWRLVTLRVDT